MNPIINTLPYDSQIEYLESTGTQWIDTLIVPNSNFSYEVEVMKLDYTETLPLGTWNSWQNAMFGIDMKYSQNGFLMTWGSTYADYTNKILNTWLTLSSKNGEQKVARSSDGYVYKTTTTTATFTCQYSAYLFAGRYNGEVNYTGPCRIAKAVIKNGDTVVFDAIPVRVGQVGYMYDKVSGQLFGNAGTGSFTLGNDVYPSFIRGIGSAAQGFAVGSSEVQKMFLGETKIYDAAPYQKIEYLQNTGSSYINTGFVNTNNTEFVIDFQLTNSSADRKIIGQGFKFGLGQMDGYWRIIDSQWYKTSSATDTNRHTARTENGAYYIDTTKIADRYSYKTAGTYNMLLFAVSSQDSVSPDGNCALMKLYSCKIYDNGSLVRDFIPVRVGSVGYLYDKVSKQLFGNAGSGSFTLGPDL